ncbi:MAG: hypothetical protein V7K82_15395 [Nostoc sp.]
MSILLPISDLPISNDQTMNANRCVIPVASESININGGCGGDEEVMGAGE